ncbi:MAG: hypothetical protein MRJ92_12790 [Nitrospira sp.]|nr:hypothetical protein [Nitrospira sp.]
MGEGERRAPRRFAVLAPAATLTGWLSRELVTQELSGARALIFPSLWYETLKDWSCWRPPRAQVPAVVADSCAARDLVIDGRQDCIFEGNARALQAAIARLQDDHLVRR